MLIGFETRSIYIIKMQIGTLQHTHTHTHSQFHLQSNRGVSERSAPPSMQTYQEKKCHLLAHPASQWSPSSSSEWRTPAAQRQELPHRWTCTLHKTHHMALVTWARCHRDSSTNKKLPLNWHYFLKIWSLDVSGKEGCRWPVQRFI